MSDSAGPMTGEEARGRLRDALEDVVAVRNGLTRPKLATTNPPAADATLAEAEYGIRGVLHRLEGGDGGD